VTGLVEEVVVEYDVRALVSSLPPLPEPGRTVRAVLDAVAGFGPLHTPPRFGGRSAVVPANGHGGLLPSGNARRPAAILFHFLGTAAARVVRLSDAQSPAHRHERVSHKPTVQRHTPVTPE
jgi:hypothetical protein